jgi:hypothetical protein
LKRKRRVHCRVSGENGEVGGESRQPGIESEGVEHRVHRGRAQRAQRRFKS